jgi:hypothetical protein
MQLCSRGNAQSKYRGIYVVSRSAAREDGEVTCEFCRKNSATVNRWKSDRQGQETPKDERGNKGQDASLREKTLGRKESERLKAERL